MKKETSSTTVSAKGPIRAKIFSSLREVVFGLEDGVVSTLGAITGIAAGTNNYFVVILSGFVIIFVESLSMSAGTFLSSKSEYEVEQHLLDEERKEIERHPEQKKKQLAQLYASKGFSAHEVKSIVDRVTANKQWWLEEMAYRTLSIIPHKQHSYVADALFMGFSYVVGGLIPLMPYFLLQTISRGLPMSLSVSIVALFILGFTKGKLVKINALKSGFEMMAVSLSAAAVGFVIGRIISYYFGV